MTEAQKAELKNLEQEHILLINEAGGFELVPYSQIDKVGGSDQPARAFVFDRAGKVYVVYWHMSGEANLAVPLPAHRVRLMKELGKTIPVKSSERGVRLPLADRLYLECRAFRQKKRPALFKVPEFFNGRAHSNRITHSGESVWPKPFMNLKPTLSHRAIHQTFP